MAGAAAGSAATPAEVEVCWAAGAATATAKNQARHAKRGKNNPFDEAQQTWLLEVLRRNLDICSVSPLCITRMIWQGGKDLKDLHLEKECIEKLMQVFYGGQYGEPRLR